MSFKPIWVAAIMALFYCAAARSQHFNLEKIDGAVVTGSLTEVEKITFPADHLVIRFKEATVSTQNLRSISSIYFDMATGAGENDSEKVNLVISPNPANRFIVISNLPDLDTRVSIYNLFGDLLQEDVVSFSSPLLKIENLSPGLYLVQVNGQTLKMIKR